MPQTSNRIKKMQRKAIETNEKIATDDSYKLKRTMMYIVKRYNKPCVVEKNIKFYIQPSWYMIIALAKCIVNNKPFLAQCAHVYIGASHVGRLLKCIQTPKNQHSIYRTSKNRHFGSLAERIVRKKYPDNQKLTKIDSRLPFICAAPDIYLDDRLIEVKSSAQDVFNFDAAILQLLISMQIFDKEIGEIHFYITEESLNNPQNRTTRFVKRLCIIKACDVFDHEFVHYVCLGYVNFLRIWQNTHGSTVDKQVIDYALKIFKENFHNRTKELWDAPPIQTSYRCLRYIPGIKFTPEDLMKSDYKNDVWSTASIRYSQWDKNQTKSILSTRNHINAIDEKDVTLTQCFTTFCSSIDKSEKTMTVESFIESAGILTNTRTERHKDDISEDKSENPEVIQVKIDQRALNILLTSYLPIVKNLAPVDITEFKKYFECC